MQPGLPAREKQTLMHLVPRTRCFTSPKGEVDRASEEKRGRVRGYDLARERDCPLTRIPR
jgi:hypothetical protein